MSAVQQLLASRSQNFTQDEAMFGSLVAQCRIEG